MRHHTGLWQSYSEVYRAGEEAVGWSVDTVFACRCDLGNVGKREGLVIRIQSEALFNAVNEI